MDKRTFLQAALGLGTVVATGHAFGQAKEPIRLGWLSSLTGPLSTPAIAENQGVLFAIEELNKAGGIDGRKVELLTRDTAGDPTKSVNFANQLIFQDKVHFIMGPLNSGEALPTVPVVARAGIPNLLVTALESLTDPVKYPRAFRVIYYNEQWLRMAHNYAIGSLKRKKIAIIGDSTGYGTATVKQSGDMLSAQGVKPVYTALVEPNRTSLNDEMTKAKDAGADVIFAFSAATGLLARLLNARGDMQWNVPVIGHQAIMTTTIKSLLNKPEYWEQTYAVGFKKMTYDADGSLPESTRQLMAAIKPRIGGQIDFSFWWTAVGVDLVKLVEHAIKTAGSTDPAALQKALENTVDFKGYYADYRFGPKQRNGFQDSDLVMNLANTFKDGCFQRAPQ